jgi:3-dehydro-L-gulonate 2-dehydrogenase
MAMSQFSYGKLEMLQLRGDQLPLPGGYDERGQLTTDPGAILKTMRPLPVGYWKGAGLALVLDLLAGLLAGGRTSHEIGRQTEETAVSQVFVAIDIARPAGADAVGRVVSAVIDDLHAAVAAPDGGAARYPGEQVLQIRARNLAEGIPVDGAVWETIRQM